MIRAILTDIEGTTSSLSFVKDVLFPYSRARIADYVRQHRQVPGVASQLAAIADIAGRALSDEDAIRLLLQWIDEDRKVTPLKALQGLIWEDGYRRGDFTGHVYEDAVRELRAWRAAGHKLYVFSSGSVLAQKLLFGHTAYGDLTPLFSGYFDTTIGAKRDPAAYRAIASETGIPAAETLFLSDIREELDAARVAGMHTCWLLREGDAGERPGHAVAKDFTTIDPDRC